MAVDEDKATEFVKAVTLLSSVLREPWAQNLVSTMNLELPTVDLSNALRGAPASSKPAVVSTPSPSASEISSKAAVAVAKQVMEMKAATAGVATQATPPEEEKRAEAADMPTPPSVPTPPEGVALLQRAW